MQRFSLSGLSPRGLYQRGQQAKPPAQPQHSPREEELPQSGTSFFSRHPCPLSCVGKNWKRILIYVGVPRDEARHLLEELLSDEAAYGQQLHTLCHVRTPQPLWRTLDTHSTLRVHVQSFYHPYLANAKLAEKPGRAEAEIMFHRVDEVPLVGVCGAAMIVSTFHLTTACAASRIPRTTLGVAASRQLLLAPGVPLFYISSHGAWLSPSGLGFMVSVSP